jgi:hypothetical protein
VTAQVGHPAYLKCAVSNQGDQLVSRIIPHSLFTTNWTINRPELKLSFNFSWTCDVCFWLIRQVSWARRRDWHILTSGRISLPLVFIFL